MRYTTVVLRRSDGFHPANQRLADDPSVSRVAVQYIHVLEDNTVVLLYHLRGDLERAQELLAIDPNVLSVTVTGEMDAVAQIHARPVQSMAAVLAVLDRYELSIQMPLEHVDGGIRLTLIGDDATAQRALADFPEDVHLNLERTGTYQPTQQSLSSSLTDRQREILTVAVDEGYYDIPRDSYSWP